MTKLSPTKNQQIKELNGRIKGLQTQVIANNQAAGIDEFIQIKVRKNQSRFERIRVKDANDKAVGHYFLLIDITAKKEAVYVPISIASSQKATGFMYHIEGTSESSISRANAEARGEGVTQLTQGTIIYAKIPAGKTASFRLQISINGKVAKQYKIVINRINYKLDPQDARYRQFLKEISAETLRFH